MEEGLGLGKVRGALAEVVGGEWVRGKVRFSRPELLLELRW